VAASSFLVKLSSQELYLLHSNHHSKFFSCILFDAKFYGPSWTSRSKVVVSLSFRSNKIMTDRVYRANKKLWGRGGMCPPLPTNFHSASFVSHIMLLFYNPNSSTSPRISCSDDRCADVLEARYAICDTSDVC
jgi:hypothetical protein